MDSRKNTVLLVFFFSLLLHCSILLSSAKAATLKLEIVENKFLQYGVLVGNVLLENESQSYFSPGNSMSVLAGDLIFYIKAPSGTVRKIFGDPRKQYSSVQNIELRKGTFVRKPICLLKYWGEYIFSEPGAYKIKADFGGIESDWVEVEVEEQGNGVEEYLSSHKFPSLITTFFSRNWVDQVIDRLDSFGDYEREQAKLVLYQLGDGDISRRILLLRDKNPATIEVASSGVRLAKKYDCAVDLWEYYLDRITNPEKINIRQGSFVYPENEFCF